MIPAWMDRLFANEYPQDSLIPHSDFNARMVSGEKWQALSEEHPPDDLAQE
jgi:hypothetical protein